MEISGLRCMSYIYLSAARSACRPLGGFSPPRFFPSSPASALPLLLLNKQGPDYDPSELELNIPWKAS